jgi:hypothetical protein
MKKRCPIKDIDIFNNELAAVNGNDPHNRKADRVRAVWGARAAKMPWVVMSRNRIIVKPDGSAGI